MLYTWDAKGRLAKVVQGTARGDLRLRRGKPQRLVSRTDAVGHTPPSATTPPSA